MTFDSSIFHIAALGGEGQRRGTMMGAGGLGCRALGICSI